MADELERNSLNSDPGPTPSKAPKPRTHWSILAIGLMSLVAGFIGGMMSLRLYDQTKLDTPEEKQAVVLNESEVISGIAEDVAPSVVSISVETQNQSGFFGQLFTQESAGTGIIVDDKGLILTNRHVIPEGASSVSVVTDDGTVYKDVEIIGRDPFNDLAFLRVDKPEGLIPAKLGDSDAMAVGDKVIAIGNALGEFSNTVTSGIISGIGRPIVASDGSASEQLSNLFQTDAAINPGNSGGPLVNVNGEVVGVNTAVAGGAENIGFAIPINDVKPVITSVQKNGEVVRPYLGVRYVILNESIAKELKIEQTQGALVTAGEGSTAVLKDSPADKAGIKEDDVITKVNTDEVNEQTPLVTLIGRYQVGDTVTLTIIRDGQEQTVQATLQEAPTSL